MRNNGADPNVNVSLVAVKGRLQSKSFSLTEGERLSIGRGDKADIQIMDHGLSRLHCAIGREADSFFVEDLGSRNGTWINGIRIKRAHLSPGDEVRIGGIEFEFSAATERRQQDANLRADVPEKIGSAIRERFDLDQTDLMCLSSKFESVENYRRVQNALATIYKIGNVIHSVTHLEGLFQILMESVLEVTESERGFLILTGDDGETLRTVVAVGAEVSEEGEAPSFSRTIVEECFSSGDSFFTPDALADERVREGESIIMQRIRSAVCVPVQTQAQILGVIYVDTVTTSEAFGRHDLELLTAIGKQAGIAIDRAALLERVQTQLYDSVRTLVATIEAKDNYTKGHSERVTAYSMQIAEEMGFVGEGLANIQLAALLHDVGKVGTPESILNKEGKLTDEEFEVIKQHPEVGAKIIQNIKDTAAIVAIVNHHHERYDGSGYPSGLSGEGIPTEARILAVADAFDAMTSDRAYRRIFSKEEVIEEFRRFSGIQFDPTAAEVFINLYERDRLYVPDLIYVGHVSGSERGPSGARFSVDQSSGASVDDETDSVDETKRSKSAH